jgi:23S rRNA (adenine2503-C2)-methyltransferase
MKADADKSIPDAQGEPRTNLLGKPESVLAKFFDGLGEKPFRARQVLQWIHQRNASRFDEMTDLSRNLREQLCEIASIELPEVVSEKKSSDGTVKWLFESGAGQAVETVFIPEPGRGTLCISSQVGCAMDCSFCATGAQGFNRSKSSFADSREWRACGNERRLHGYG